MNKNFIVLISIILVIVIIVAICIPQKESDENLLGINYNIKGNVANLDYDTENPVVAMHIENYGSIVMELYPDVAPNTVNNFISLVKAGFYDNNTFHRLDEGFVLQGGDPTGTGGGGPGYTIDGEFSNNGFENNLSHEKWVVSMGRQSGDPNSAGSQFFICIEDATYLDGNYAAFGKIIDGFSNIEKIEKEEETIGDENGTLKRHLIIEKTLIDLKEKEYSEVIKNS